MGVNVDARIVRLRVIHADRKGLNHRILITNKRPRLARFAVQTGKLESRSDRGVKRQGRGRGGFVLGLARPRILRLLGASRSTSPVSTMHAKNGK